MKASELIVLLADQISDCGDMDVYLDYDKTIKVDGATRIGRRDKNPFVHVFSSKTLIKQNIIFNIEKQ